MNVKYKLVEREKDSLVAVRIDEGQYDSVIFQIGKVHFEEQNDPDVKGNLSIGFDYHVMGNPRNVDIDGEYAKKEIEEIVGDIILDIMHDHFKSGGTIENVGNNSENREDDTEKSDTERGVLSEGNSISEE